MTGAQDTARDDSLVQEGDAVFRDAPTGRVDQLKRELVAALVGVAKLPVDVPAFGLRLLDLETDVSGFTLLFGQEAPTFGICYRRERGAVQVGIVDRGPEGARAPEAAVRVQKRLARALTPEKWEQASGLADRIGALHAEPMRHYRHLIQSGARGFVRLGPPHGPDQIQTWIEDMHRVGCRYLIVGGDDPLRCAGLEEHVAFAKGLEFEEVNVELEARDAIPTALLARLSAVVSLSLFVRLPAARPTPGDPEPLTLTPQLADGLRFALDKGMPVKLDVPLTSHTLPLLSAFPDHLRTILGQRGRLVTLTLTVAQRVQRDQGDLTPAPDRVREVLPRVIDAADRLGIAIEGLGGPAGLPLCAHGADPRVVDFEVTLTPDWSDRIHPPECEPCAAIRACRGVRKADYERFGERAVAVITQLPEALHDALERVGTSSESDPPGRQVSLPSDSYCALAWTSLHVSTDGSARVCCLNDDVIRDNGGAPHNLAVAPLAAVWTSEHWEHLRGRLLAGERPGQCRRCWEDEDAGRQSRRMTMNGRLVEATERPLAEAHLEVLALSLGNRCNLKCVTCGPEQSSSWLDDAAAWERAELGVADEASPVKRTAAYREWPANGAVFDGVEDLLSDLRIVELVGGEPFIIPQVAHFVRLCVDTDHARHIELEITTNGTIFPVRLMELLSRFEQVQLVVSVDGIGPRFEYMRYPARWLALCRNLDRFVAAGFAVSLNYTCSLYNAWYIPEFHAFAQDRDLSYRLHPVEGARFQIGIVSGGPRDAIQGRIERHLTTLEPGSLAERETRALLARLVGTAADPQALADFHRFTRFHDARRGTDFDLTFPEWASLLASD